MPRSSDSVAALAAALAKAQAELVNPEKSLTATIRTGQPGEGERSFRYAPLSSGLDIVRKTLGQHEIATVQTTAIDHAAGMVNLTTTLAHASGEWIASDWPVCPIAETTNPQRMGAALTYARRYALFTLVGIAGEDDLDARNIREGAPSPGPANDAGAESKNPLRLPSRTSGNGHGRGRTKVASPALLDADESAARRDKLLADVRRLSSLDEAAAWARGALRSKNSLTASDAKLVEEAFEQRFSKLPPAAVIEASPAAEVVKGTVVIPNGGKQEAATDEHSHQPGGINKSTLAIPAPRRYRHKAHLRYVAQQPCLLCGRKPSDPHHLRFMQPRALGRKASDEFSVPLCRIHHRLVHRVGNEAAWWKEAGIDPNETARKLWGRTRHAEGRERTSAPHELSRSASDQDGILPSGGKDAEEPDDRR